QRCACWDHTRLTATIAHAATTTDTRVVPRISIQVPNAASAVVVTPKTRLQLRITLATASWVSSLSEAVVDAKTDVRADSCSLRAAIGGTDQSRSRFRAGPRSAQPVDPASPCVAWPPVSWCVRHGG